MNVENISLVTSFDVVRSNIASKILLVVPIILSIAPPKCYARGGLNTLVAQFWFRKILIEWSSTKIESIPIS
jgi:hypothetical protein